MALLTVLTFIIINFLIIFKVKTRTTTITSLIISHLILVLFFAFSIANYNSFKEIVLALVAYSMVILFLVSNYNPIFSNNSDQYQAPLIKDWRFRIIVSTAAVFLLIVIFLSIFVMVKNISKVSAFVNDDKLEKQAEIIANPMILPSHPVHNTVKKFYLEKNFAKNDNAWYNKKSSEELINEKKQARLKDQLSDNFLLKRSSDVILIIVAVSSGMLLLSKKKNI